MLFCMHGSLDRFHVPSGVKPIEMVEQLIHQEGDKILLILGTCHKASARVGCQGPIHVCYAVDLWRGLVL